MLDTTKPLLTIIMFTCCTLASAVPFDSFVYTSADDDLRADSVAHTPKRIRRIDAELRWGHIFATNDFLKTENMTGEWIENSFSGHARYAFGFEPCSVTDKVYSGAYQGVGLAYYSFGRPEELGNPVAIYLFQGARAATFSERISLNYEWNFGLSAGWKPYDADSNNKNMVIGSKLNAYMNVDIYARWRLMPQLDVTSGLGLTHFSNGNTKFPNAGLNLVGFSTGLTYWLNNQNGGLRPYQKLGSTTTVPHFPKHISYDVLLFGAWRRKGIYIDDVGIASPHTYAVAGFSIAPMYNFNYRFRAGISVDGVYDGSANIYTEDNIIGVERKFYSPPAREQLALGLSGRAEYVMPYFTVGVGMGANVLHNGGDLRGHYQIISLKIEASRSSFIHVGYNIKDFHEPRFLILGLGYRFNNRRPYLYK